MSAGDGGKYRLTPMGKLALWFILPFSVVVESLFAFFGQLEIGMGLGVAVGMLAIAMRATWHLHGYRWYWVAVTVSALLEVPGIFAAQLSHHAITGKGVLLFAYPDFFVVWGSIKLAERLMMSSEEYNLLREE
jgi:hypothetical protein